MSNFDSHFIFHADGGPFPGTCVRCGAINKLWNIGMIPASNMTALICNTCLTELAIFAGFVTGHNYADLNATKTAIIDKQQAQIDVTPTLLEKFSNDITNIIGEFVTGLASVAVPNKPIQPKSDQADAGSTEPVAESKPASGSSKGKNSHPSAKSTSN
jgi:hypothetical protein